MIEAPCGRCGSNGPHHVIANTYDTIRFRCEEPGCGREGEVPA